MKISFRPLPMIFLVSLLTALPGCRSTPEPLPEEEPVSASIPLVSLKEDAVVYYDDRGGFIQPVKIVVRRASDWIEIWDQATSMRNQPPRLPHVDFEEEMLALVSLGISQLGDRVHIDRAGIGEGLLHGEEVFEVHIREFRDCGTVAVQDIQPVLIVRLPRYDGPLSFVEKTERAQCN